MGNSRNKKLPKKRKTPNKRKGQRASDQKENVPKPVRKKVLKPKPNGSIAKSKQLMTKQRNVNTDNRRSSRLNEKCHVNRKPNLSLAELENLYADSDEDDESPKTPPQTPATSQNEEGNILSPTTISKISERVMDLIECTDPAELLQEVAPLLEPPPLPVIPVKKKKKSGIPYIVGCKDRPQVIRKPTVKFCKGDEKYGVNSSDNEESDEPPKKRAKPSRIPNYSKSIFNAKSDEIAERLINEDGDESDASVDSNKTVEYDPTPYQNSRPHSFSPLPSTSRDDQTFMRNDELFNESLKESKGETDETKEVKDTVETVENVVMNETVATIDNKENIIDMSYETIVIDDAIDVEPRRTTQSTTNAIDEIIIEDIEQQNLVDVKPKDIVEVQTVLNDNNDDCIIVPSGPKSEHQTISNNNPIVIEDEYSTIVNMDLDTYNNEPIEIIDVDDVIAENKSLLDKIKNNATKELNKINTVVNVPASHSNSNAQQKNVEHTSSDEAIIVNDNKKTSSQSKTPSQPPTQKQSERTEQSPNNQIVPSTPWLQRNRAFREIVRDFFNLNSSPRSKPTPTMSNDRSLTESIGDIFARVVKTFENNGRNRATKPSANGAAKPVSSQTVNNKQKEKNNMNPTKNTTSTVTQEISNSEDQDSTMRSRNLGDCPICLDPLMSKGIASTICGHVFCLKCIQTAIKANGRKCPTCRKALKGTGGGYHQLFL